MWPGSTFYVELWPRSRFHVETSPRVIIPRWIVTPGLDSTLNYDPGSEFLVVLWPRVIFQRLIVTWELGHYHYINTGSQFNVEFWHGVTIQREILTRGNNSTWISDPSTYLLPVELRLKKVSKFNSVIKIQQLSRVTIQRKIHWILTPGRYSIGGSKFYLTPARPNITCKTPHEL